MINSISKKEIEQLLPHREPMLLIDELESGLDENALVRISEYIKNIKNQSLITALNHHKIKEMLSAKTILPKQYNC